MPDDKECLGELAFSAEDFDCNCDRRFTIEPCRDSCARVQNAHRANRILAEKLRRMPHVYGTGRPPSDCDNDLLQYYSWSEIVDDETDTHSARLVCLESIK